MTLRRTTTLGWGVLLALALLLALQIFAKRVCCLRP